jgi:hypothetical protein
VKPNAKQKPINLRGTPLSPVSPASPPPSEKSEPDLGYLKDDLLEEGFEDGFEDTSPASYRYQDQTPQFESSFDDAAPNRLVLAIDYGTTFTGKRNSFPPLAVRY